MSSELEFTIVKVEDIPPKARGPVAQWLSKLQELPKGKALRISNLSRGQSASIRRRVDLYIKNGFLSNEYTVHRRKTDTKRYAIFIAHRGEGAK